MRGDAKYLAAYTLALCGVDVRATMEAASALRASYSYADCLRIVEAAAVLDGASDPAGALDAARAEKRLDAWTTETQDKAARLLGWTS